MARQKICGCGKILKYNEVCSCRERKEYVKQYNERNKESQSQLTTERWKRKRAYIIKRDGGICQRCWLKYGIVNAEDLQVHHIKPRIKYPELMYDDKNLICICGVCNRQIGIREQLDFDWETPEDNIIL